QLGETSKVLTGADAGLRGTLEWGANVKGTFAESNVQTWIKLEGLRRSEFFPAQPISAEIRCGLRATNRFLTLEDVKCEAPVDTGAVALAGRIDDVREPEKAEIQLGLRKVAADTLLNWGKVASSRVSPQWAASGTVDADLTYGDVSGWKGHVTANKLGLTAKNHEVIKDQTIELTDAAVTPVVFKGRPGLKPENGNLQGDLRRYAFTFDRLPVELGGETPAQVSGRFDSRRLNPVEPELPAQQHGSAVYLRQRCGASCARSAQEVME
ncbi:MAG: hypothetical protein JF584_13830, partial [Acidobacteria bacterium]|nr:hypothetical protein [Acidobacteriota bacterium]